MKRELALVLLIVGMVASYSWRFAPDGTVPEVWNIATHMHTLLLLLLVGAWASDRAVWWVIALVAVWQVLPAACSVWWLIDGPWPVSPNNERCSRRLEIPLGLIGLGAAVWLAGAVYKMRRGGHGP